MLFALFFLGLLQGLTEFLPVSSSGHLILFSHIFGIEENLFVSILLHVATLFSVVVVFRKEIFYIVCHPFSTQTTNLALSTIISCTIVLILLPIVKLSFSGKWLGFCFLISSLFLFLSDKRQTKVGMFNTKIASIMGIAQGLAVFPGISRSGTTISAGVMFGGERESASKFSFLMSIPIILASLVMEFFELDKQGFPNIPIVALIISFLTAFVVGILSIKLMLKITQKSNLKCFSLYLIFISVVAFIIL